MISTQMVTASESDAATSATTSPKHSMDVDEDEPMEHESIKLDAAINGAKLKGLNGNSNGHGAKHANGLVNGFKHGSNGVSDDEKSSDAETNPKMVIDDKNVDDEEANNENKCNGGDNHVLEHSEESMNGDEAVVSEERVKKYKLLKLEKNLKLKQLKLDLCNEEAKLMLLKRLYYSQKLMPSLQKPQQAPNRGQIGAGVQNKGLLQQQQQQQRPLPNSSNIQQQPRTLINNNRVFIGFVFFFWVGFGVESWGCF